MSDYFDQLFSSFDEQRAMADLAQAEEAVAKANAVVQSRRQLIRAYEAWRAAQAGPGSKTVHVQSAASQATRVSVAKSMVRAQIQGDPKSPTGRDAIKSVFLDGNPNAEWTIPGIAEGLDLDLSYHKRIGITLQRLVSDGAVVRLRQGVYQLPPATVPAGAGEEREADSENDSQNGSGQVVRSSDLFGLAGPAPS